jgi:tetrahydromethanopterin S-methyltransferase subunit A
VAVSTLASVDLAQKLADSAPPELCIVGKTETENIGVEKVIRNTISNPSLHFLLLCGNDPQGHRSGATLLALHKNGVDDTMRVIDSPGKRPVLKNSSTEEVEAFRQQIKIIDMVGEQDVERIAARLANLSSSLSLPCHDTRFASKIKGTTLPSAEIIEAEAPDHIPMDKAGYFVVIPEREKGRIIVEHYSYDNKLLRVIQGKTARDLYHTMIKNKWVSTLTHAAYLGKELEKAELSMNMGFSYVQDGA